MGEAESGATRRGGGRTHGAGGERGGWGWTGRIPGSQSPSPAKKGFLFCVLQCRPSSTQSLAVTAAAEAPALSGVLRTQTGDLAPFRGSERGHRGVSSLTALTGARGARQRPHVTCPARCLSGLDLPPVSPAWRGPDQPQAWALGPGASGLGSLRPS